MFKAEIREQLEQKILPFWMGMKDGTYGGFYGLTDHKDLGRQSTQREASCADTGSA